MLVQIQMNDLSKQRTFSNSRRKKDPGFPAKWNCWDQFGPGVAPSERQLEKKSEIGREKSHLVIGAWKTPISRPIFIAKQHFCLNRRVRNC